jgi:hypothetical protein
LAEQWGVLIIKANVELARVFSENEGQLRTAMNQLAAVSGLNPEMLFERRSAVGKIEVKDEYISIGYDCANWVPFSEYVVNASNSIEYYACHGDEYGKYWLFSVANGVRFSLCIEVDLDEIDDSTRIEIRRWLMSLPTKVIEQFPDINIFESEDYEFDESME